MPVPDQWSRADCIAVIGQPVGQFRDFGTKRLRREIRRQAAKRPAACLVGAQAAPISENRAVPARLRRITPFRSR